MAPTRLRGTAAALAATRSGNPVFVDVKSGAGGVLIALAKDGTAARKDEPDRGSPDRGLSRGNWQVASFAMCREGLRNGGRVP